MNVLLLYPRFPDTFWSFRHALAFVRKRASLPPLGLVTVAALLPRSWTLRLVDVNVRSLSAADLEWADLVMVSAMLAQRDSARSLIARAHAAGKRVVAGGPLFNGEHESFPEVDHFVLDEAEASLPEFLRDFEQGCARRVYTAASFPELDRTPVPRWDLLERGRYASLSLQYSRGCPFDCEFCDITVLFGRRPRVKSAVQVIAELDALHDTGWRGPVFFVDDNFIGNRRALRNDLLPALIEWRRSHPGLRFYTEASINLADDEALMAQMVAAGFDTVFVGIETPTAEGLAECDKRQNRGRDMVADVKRMQRAGLQVQGGFIVGFDSDREGIFQAQWEFIQASGIVTAMVGLLNAIPGTRLHERLKGEGRLLEKSSGNNSDGTTNFVPRMDRAKLEAGYRALVRRLYAPGPYYQRVRTFLREYHPPRVRARISWADLHALGRSMWRLGLVGRERYQYWRLLAWTFFRRPRQVPLAVTLAIYGHHFRRTSQALGR
jgi:radical SAM superfamily enzyme YgiQ (UPF0313 family)